MCRKMAPVFPHWKQSGAERDYYGYPPNMKRGRVTIVLIVPWEQHCHQWKRKRKLFSLGNQVHYTQIINVLFERSACWWTQDFSLSFHFCLVNTKLRCGYPCAHWTSISNGSQSIPYCFHHFCFSCFNFSNRNSYIIFGSFT